MSNQAINRRTFLGRGSAGIGFAAAASLLAADDARAVRTGGLAGLPHFAAKAKRVIYLVMSGGPSQLDLFDPKPQLSKHRGSDLKKMPEIQMGQRITGMTSGQQTLPIAPSIFKFAKHGKCGTEVSELLPHTAGVVDDLCLIRTLNTEAINHDPGITFLQTGAQQPGRPSFGAWLSYGLGAETDNLPAFVVLISQGSGNKVDQPIFSRLWGPGFLPSEHQGVRLRSGADPVLYLSNPEGIDRDRRRRMLDALGQLNEQAAQEVGDPEINTRIAQYELAFKMQASVPELTDLTKENKTTIERYGIKEDGVDGGFARNCLLARRMVERGVRFVQLMHKGWDQHGGLPGQIRGQCKDVDQPVAALVADLKERGMLQDTLVIFGGEFGRTVYSQGALTEKDYGRDHHGRCFSMWVAGGGIKPGAVYGETDDFSYNIVKDGVHVHDFNATLLHCLGLDHERLTYKFQGRYFRLTDIHGTLVKGILA